MIQSNERHNGQLKHTWQQGLRVSHRLHQMRLKGWEGREQQRSSCLVGCLCLWASELPEDSCSSEDGKAEAGDWYLVSSPSLSCRVPEAAPSGHLLLGNWLL